MPFREVGPCGGARQLPHNAGALTRSAMQNTAMPSWINFLNSLIPSRSKTILVSISGGTSSKMTESVPGEGTRPYSRTRSRDHHHLAKMVQDQALFDILSTG